MLGGSLPICGVLKMKGQLSRNIFNVLRVLTLKWLANELVAGRYALSPVGFS
jgi:hypothetical protein